MAAIKRKAKRQEIRNIKEQQKTLPFAMTNRTLDKYIKEFTRKYEVKDSHDQMMEELNSEVDTQLTEERYEASRRQKEISKRTSSLFLGGRPIRTEGDSSIPLGLPLGEALRLQQITAGGDTPRIITTDRTTFQSTKDSSPYDTYVKSCLVGGAQSVSGGALSPVSRPSTAAVGSPRHLVNTESYIKGTTGGLDLGRGFHRTGSHLLPNTRPSTAQTVVRRSGFNGVNGVNNSCAQTQAHTDVYTDIYSHRLSTPHSQVNYPVDLIEPIDTPNLQMDIIEQENNELLADTDWVHELETYYSRYKNLSKNYLTNVIIYIYIYIECKYTSMGYNIIGFYN